MKVFQKLPLSPFPPHPVLTIGNFDGQHVGHRALVTSVVELARRRKGTPMVLTFDPHPATVLNPGLPLQFLSSQEQKRDFFQGLGIEFLIFLEFNHQLASFTPIQFVERILRDGIGVRDVIVGKTFAFGKGRSGQVQDLIQLGSGANFNVHPFLPIRVDDQIVSSTRIRRCIQDGKVHDAARYLGRYYSLGGRVIRGEGRGSELGWPTANLSISADRVVPPDGVYVTTTVIKGEVLKSVSYIGRRPTFVEGVRMLEVHLLDMNRSLYDEELKVNFIERLRGDQKFSTIADLVRQMESDANSARERLQSLMEDPAKNPMRVGS